MEQFIEKRRLQGAGSDSICDCYQLAMEAWGDRCEEKNSGMLAFAYLWRRFGPPWGGSDDHKRLVGYTLTTADPDVFLTLNLSGAGLSYSTGYMADESFREKVNQPMAEWCKRYDEWWWKQHPELADLEVTDANREKVSEIYWNERVSRGKEAANEIGPFPKEPDPRQWRETGGVIHRVNQALFDAMQELLVPVYVRDCPINIFGRCEDSYSATEQSVYAGYGLICAKPKLDEMVAEDNQS